MLNPATHRAVTLALAVGFAVLTAAGPASAAPQDDPPPVRVSADNSITPTGTSAATVTLTAAGSSGGALEAGQEQQVIQAAATAAGVPPRAPTGGAAAGESAPAVEGAGTGLITTECSWRAATIAPTDPRWAGRDPAAGQLMVNPCNGDGTYVYVPNDALGVPAAPPPPPDPAVLAQQAYAQIAPPMPAVYRSPGQDNADPDRGNQPYTWVNLWTWFWTGPAEWAPRTSTVELRGVSATVTATPQALTFDPGDGSTPVVCEGPGRPWVQADGNTAPTAGGCGHMYREVSDGVTATTTATWSINWTSNTGAGGALPDLTATATSDPFLIEQIQIVVTPNQARSGGG